MSDQTLLSICIPTYNGAGKLPETLDGILPQIGDAADIEIIICDDRSTDDTCQIAQAYAADHPAITLHAHQENLGMDRNFLRAASHAGGRYIWLTGQDDVYEPGAIDRFRQIVTQHPETGLIFFNHQRRNADLSVLLSDRRIETDTDQIFAPAQCQDCLDLIAPGIGHLPACVYRRDLWEHVTDKEKYFGTYYCQMGIFMEILPVAHTYVVADPRYITARYPDDGWQQSGDMLLDAFIGKYRVFHLIAQRPPGQNPISPEHYARRRRFVIRHIPRRVLTWVARGISPKPSRRRHLADCFGPLLRWFWIYPVLYLPRPIARLIVHTYYRLSRKPRPPGL